MAAWWSSERKDNVLLDEVNRELERRGHRFARYADDCNVLCAAGKPVGG